MPAPRDRALATFDVFDTVLTRAVGEPRSIGYVLAERWRAEGLTGLSPEMVVAARQRAEHLCFERYGERRTTAHCSAQLAELLGLDPAFAARLTRDEVQVELELARPVPAQIRRVAHARAAGRVGFLSDTPLPRTALQQLLRRVGAMQDGDLLWASNELGAEKSSGRAYAAVVRRLGGPPEPWQHTGDDPWADVRMARWVGVRSTLAPQARLQRYERCLESAAPGTAGLASLLAGAARRARLVLEAEGAQDGRTSAITGVIGPLLAAYALDAARSAREAGCQVLVLEGQGAIDLLAVAAPLRLGVRLQLAGPTDPADRWAVAGTDVLQGQARPGPAVRWHSGTEVGATRDARGWLFDERAASGVSGAGADAVRVLPLLFGSGHPGFAAFGDELATSLGLLPAAGDLREAVQSAFGAFWRSPSPDEVAAWCQAVPGLDARWPQGRSATAVGVARLAGRAEAGAGPLLRRAQRAAVLTGLRRQVRGRR